jgi:hypothetical protein
VRAYSREGTREFASALFADHPLDPPAPRVEHVYPVAAGGTWQTDAWRDELARLLADGRPLIGIGMRTAPADPVLPDHIWTDIAQQLARHDGLLDHTPWVAPRTGEQSVVVLAQTNRPPTIAALWTSETTSSASTRSAPHAPRDTRFRRCQPHHRRCPRCPIRPRRPNHA